MPLAHVVRGGGPFLFFGSHVASHGRAGQPVTRYIDANPADANRLRTGNLMIDAPAERAVAQTCRIIRDLEASLVAMGGSLQDLVQQRWFVRDEGDLAAVARALAILLQDALPATTLVAADGPGLAPEVAVHADFIALARPSAWTVRHVRIADVDSLTYPFPAATRAGPFLFTTPVAGVDLATGRVVTAFRDLDPSARELAEPPYAGRGEAAAAQQVQVFRHVERILSSQGTSLACQVRQNGWMRMPMSEFGPASAVRRQLFSSENTGPFTSLTVSGLRSADALFEYGVIALVPGDAGWKRALRNPPHGIASYYVAAVQAGPLVVSAGEVPVDAAAGWAVTALSAGAQKQGRIDAAGVALAQAFDVYAKLERTLSDYGAAMSDVVHQTLYVVDGADVLAIERVAALIFGHTLPPTTVVPILSTSPFRESRLEIELIAAIGPAPSHLTHPELPST
jgi:enamine deaminase RidA (YjgF/YER057c/UK114 family)